MTALKPPDQPSTARVLVQTLSTSPGRAASSVQIEDVCYLWIEGLASGDPQPVNDDWFASISKRGMERVQTSAGPADLTGRNTSDNLFSKNSP